MSHFTKLFLEGSLPYNNSQNVENLILNKCYELFGDTSLEWHRCKKMENIIEYKRKKKKRQT